MYAYPEIKTFGGLYLQQNSFNTPDGALEIANNVTIPSEDIIQKCRGYYEYYSDESDFSLNNLFLFRDFLFSISTDRIAYYTDDGYSPNFIGVQHILDEDTSAQIEVSEIDVSRSLQSNGNLYFTTDNGVFKLASETSKVYQSGSPQGLDISASLAIGYSADFLKPGKTLGYRVLFGYTDENDNLILGPPSSIVSVTNPLVESVNCTTPGGNPTVFTVTSPAHGLVTGMYLLMILPDPTPMGSTLTSAASGQYQITVTGTDTFTYQNDTMNAAQSGPINYGYNMPIRLEFTVPSEISINLSWFYQLYRTGELTNAIRSDFRLVVEAQLTSQEISDRIIFVSDDNPNSFLGAYLYTNENSREGELQANYRPPRCIDLCLFNNYSIYANCITRHILELGVVNTTNIASNYLYLSITSVPYYFDIRIVRSRRYLGRHGVGNQTNRGICSDSGGDLLVTYTDAGLVSSATSGMWSVYISNASGGVLSQGTYYAYYISADSWKLCTSVANWISGTFVPIGTISSLYFEFVNSGTTPENTQSFTRTDGIVTFSTNSMSFSYQMSVFITNSTGAPGTAIVSGIYLVTTFTGSTFSFYDGLSDVGAGNTASYNSFDPIFKVNQSSGTLTPGAANAEAAQGIVKAINRDPQSLIYAQYASSFNESPGHMVFQSKGFGPPIYAFETSTLAGQGFFPVLPIDNTNPVFSTDQELPNGFYSSKFNEPEAVPLVNFFPIGSKSAQILRIHTLKYSMIVIKEDGVWRVTGDNPSNFTITLVDETVKCLAPSSSKVINNQVIMLSNQGICLITESSVTIISRKIEDVIQPLLTQGLLSENTSAVSYEIDRQYLITTELPGLENEKKVYSYNILTDGWTTTDFIFKQSIVGPGNVIYYIDFENNIKKERKNNTKIDYCSQNHDIMCNLVSFDKLSAKITSTEYSPKYGDVIVGSYNIMNIIIESFQTAGGEYTVTFLNLCNLDNETDYILYESYESIIKFSPYSGGLVGRSKQFSQMQVHFRDYCVEKMNISFSGDTFGGSKPTDWTSKILLQGWGSFPWGIGNWGQSQTIYFKSGTTSSPICRIYIPRYQQRGTFIQPILSNSIGGDRLNIQSLSFNVRTYGARVTK